MQQWLRVAIGLVKSLENQVACGFECHGCLEVAIHGQVIGVFGILRIDNLGHPLKSLPYHFGADNAVVQPVRNMLA